MAGDAQQRLHTAVPCGGGGQQEHAGPPTTPAEVGRPRADPALGGVDPAKGRPDPAPGGEGRGGTTTMVWRLGKEGGGEREGGGKEEAGGAGFGLAPPAAAAARPDASWKQFLRVEKLKGKYLFGQVAAKLLR